MRKKVNINLDVERYNPDHSFGLTEDQISKRKEQGLDNKTELVVGKSTWEIIRTDVFSFFNIMLFVLAAFMIVGNCYDPLHVAKWYSGLFFLFVVLGNVILTLYQDFKAKHLMKKMKLLTTPKARVIRNGVQVSIDPVDIVLDDIIHLKSNDQIPSDSIIVEGEVYVNESLLTGESENVLKRKGDKIYSGTFITSGTCYSKVENVGKDNYIETLSAKSKAFKRNPSIILKSLNRLFRVLGILIVTLFVIITATYLIQGSFATFDGFINTISPITGQFVAMIPAGLYLLTSVTLATGVVALYKKHANVQDFYSIEMLARSDVLCVDKTGTITDGTMVLKKIVSKCELSEEEIGNIVCNIVNATGDENFTAVALKNALFMKKTFNLVKALPFTSENKYSGASFDNGETYLLGAVEFMNMKNAKDVEEEVRQFSTLGYRVLVLAKGNKAITGKNYVHAVEPIGIVVLQDHVKEDAKETFKWFASNGVEVKVISGDNALTVSQIAIEAGINNAHKYISLEGMPIEEVKKIASEYNVFGRVTPEQKEALIIALKEQGKTVAMTGDGANDMLALKRADCSIAMNSGAEAAKNVSHIVLLTNDFSTMPEIVSEGRRVINNIDRTGSLFLTKTTFAILLSIGFWIVAICTANKYAYPFAPSNLMVWEIFGFGLPAFFISLERNPKPIQKGFLSHILKKAIPAGIILVIGVVTCFVCFVLQKNGLAYTGVSDFGFLPEYPRLPRTGATAIAVLVFTTLSIMILFNTCRPINKYRGFVILGSLVISATCFLVGAFLPDNIFLIDFQSITNSNLMLWVSIVLILSFVIYFMNPITDSILSLFAKIKNKMKKEK